MLRRRRTLTEDFILDFIYRGILPALAIMGFLFFLFCIPILLSGGDEEETKEPECQVVSKSEKEVHIHCSLPEAPKETPSVIEVKTTSNTPPLFDTKDSPIKLKIEKDGNEKDPMCLHDCSHLPGSGK